MVSNWKERYANYLKPYEFREKLKDLSYYADEYNEDTDGLLTSALNGYREHLENGAKHSFLAGLLKRNIGYLVDSARSNPEHHALWPSIHIYSELRQHHANLSGSFKPHFLQEENS